MKRTLIILTSIILSLAGLSAQDGVKFTAEAPSTVYMETPFQLVYFVNASGKELRAPDFQFFEILAGPFESRSSSYQMINGKTSSSVNVSFTFTLMANKTGTFKIPGASITVDGETVHSNGLTIKVLPASQSGSGNQQGGGNITRENEPQAAPQSISNENIFIRTSFSKTNVYEQEAILVTYKLYTLLDVLQFTDMKFPDFNGFLKQEIEQPQNKQLNAESYNGRNYGTVVLYQVLLFPQRTGEIQIGRANFTATIRVQNRNQVRSIFDDFFDSYSNVSKTLTAQGANIVVKELPSGKPASFTGSVGRFNLSSSISSTSVKANEAVTIKVVVTGTGNMKLLKNPEIKFPDNFEVYDPKADNKFSTNSAGVSGTKTIEYMFIPRYAGTYEIPSAELSYFDLQDETYKTLRTSPYRLTVAKGEGGEGAVVGNYTGKEDVKQLAKDIRYINTDKIKLTQEETPLFGTFLFWMLFLIPLVVAGILFIFLRKQIKENANISLVKNKRANKVAQKRLKLAQKFLNEGKKPQFYEEVMKATWTYLSDKLSIPVAELNKENIQAEMASRGINNELINDFINILNTCEFASYAPNSGQQEMGNIYEETADAIGKIEEHFRKNNTK